MVKVLRIFNCFTVGAVLLAFLFAGCFQQQAANSKRAQAASLSEKQQYKEAIEAYWEHIHERQAVQNKPDWENPYIYLLDIGDLYIAMGDFDKALEMYELADTKGVKPGYVNDRLRHVGSLYEEQGDLQKAIEHLQKYRERDEILFDLMLNRLARQLVVLEEKKEAEISAEDSEDAGDLNSAEAKRVH